MDNENPNYQPNAFSRFYESIIAGAGKVWKHRSWVGRHYLTLVFAYAIVLGIFWVPLIYTVWDNVATLTAALGEVEGTARTVETSPTRSASQSLPSRPSRRPRCI